MVNASGTGLGYLSTLAEWKGTGDFNLDNIKLVLARLGDPQNKVKSIHVTGTNGKGSVTAGISSILGTSGARTGMTISPHLVRVNERIVIDGSPIGDDSLDQLALELKKCCDALDVKLSFFEGITAISFLAFAELKLDWMVAEVGLGGRLDATNAIAKPEVSVIVSIDKDHEHILGDTLTRIAFEKAGIIKENAKVVIGALDPEAASVIREVCRERNASSYELGRDFELVSFPDKESGQGRYTFNWKGQDGLSFTPSLRGEHQGANMALALAAASLVGVDSQSMKRGVEQVFWPARLERINTPCASMLIDCAHNPAGIKSLVQYLECEGLREVVIGFGALETKHWQEMLELLVPYVKSWNLLRPEAPCALDPAMLARHLSGMGINSRNFDRDYRGFIETIPAQSGRQAETGKPLVLICGSMYLIGIIRQMLVSSDPVIWKRLSHEGRG